MSDPDNGVESINIDPELGRDDGISRREFLKGALITGGATVMAACTPEKSSIPVSGVESDEYPIYLVNRYPQEDPEGAYEYLWRHVPDEIHLPIEILVELGEENVQELCKHVRAYFDWAGFVRNHRITSKNITQECNIRQGNFDGDETYDGYQVAGSHQYINDSDSTLRDEIVIDFNTFRRTYEVAGGATFWNIDRLSAILIHELAHANKENIFTERGFRMPFTVPNLGEASGLCGFKLFFKSNQDPMIYNSLVTMEEAAVSFISTEFMKRQGLREAENYAGYIELYKLMTSLHDQEWFETKKLSDALQRSDLEWFVKSVRGRKELTELDYVATVCWFMAAQEGTLSVEEIFKQMEKFRGKKLDEKNFRTTMEENPKLAELVKKKMERVLVSTDHKLVLDIKPNLVS